MCLIVLFRFIRFVSKKVYLVILTILKMYRKIMVVFKTLENTFNPINARLFKCFETPERDAPSIFWIIPNVNTRCLKYAMLEFSEII